MTLRLVLRTLSVNLDALKDGILLPDKSRTISVIPSGSVGKLDIVIEQEMDVNVPEKKKT